MSFQLTAQLDTFVTGSGQGLRVHWRPPVLTQVCESLADPQMRKRELAALGEAMTEVRVKTATIVTRAEDEQIDTDAGMIDVV